MSKSQQKDDKKLILELTNKTKSLKSCEISRDVDVESQLTWKVE